MAICRGRYTREQIVVAIIQNSTEIPQVTADFHLLKIEAIELVEGTKWGEPEVPETRVKMTVRVMTPDEESVSFAVWMSQNLGPRSTLGSIYRAIMQAEPPRGAVDTDDLVGRKFRTMVTHNDNGWPKLVAGTAAPAAKKSGAVINNDLPEEALVGLGSSGEPPF